MPLPATNLTAIRKLVRLLTKSPSENILSTPDLDDYVNTFILYDFPEHLRIFALHTTLTFYTKPFIDTYETNTTVPTDPLYDFKNLYTSINGPAYIAGFKVLYTQSREQFYNIYPFINSQQLITTGNGVTTNFTGVIPGGGVPFLQNQVLFNGIDVNANGLAITDFPISSEIGNLRIPNQPPTSTTVVDPNNFINYLTGQYSVTFPTAPETGTNINAQIVPYVSARPQALLFYDEDFTVRPVPDQVYQVNIEVYKRPTALLQAGTSPQLNQWWQYIAYGAAKKVLEQRLDLDTVAIILPEYKKQELLVLRSTIALNANQRTATIYTEQTSVLSGPWGWNQNSN